MKKSINNFYFLHRVNKDSKSTVKFEYVIYDTNICGTRVKLAPHPDVIFCVHPMTEKFINFDDSGEIHLLGHEKIIVDKFKQIENNLWKVI